MRKFIAKVFSTLQSDSSKNAGSTRVNSWDDIACIGPHYDHLSFKFIFDLFSLSFVTALFSLLYELFHNEIVNYFLTSDHLGNVRSVKAVDAIDADNPFLPSIYLNGIRISAPDFMKDTNIR